MQHNAQSEWCPNLKCKIVARDWNTHCSDHNTMAAIAGCPGITSYGDVDSIAAALKRNRQMLRNLGNKKRTMWKVLCCLFAITSANVAPAAAYLKQQQSDMQMDEEELHTSLQHWYQQQNSNNTLAAVLSPSTISETRVLHSAKRFLKEWQLHAWVEKTNVDKGIAPAAALLCQLGGPPGIEPTAIPFPTDSTARQKSKLQWCRRWRRRWDVDLGTIAPGERLEDSVAQAKVATEATQIWKAYGAARHHPTQMRPPKQNHFLDHILVDTCVGRASFGSIAWTKKRGQ